MTNAVPIPTEPGLFAPQRLRIQARGAVQGVGFRPFVFRLARELELAGFVENTNQGVTIEVEGPRERLDELRRRLVLDKPPLARLDALDILTLGSAGVAGFAIRPSARSGTPVALVLPDIATCADCRRETRDPRDRRYRYPFTNCTNCGPRYSIVLDLPYDRARTTMAGFRMCARCRAEYEDPADRRFHAEPIACPACGPRLRLVGSHGAGYSAGDKALWDAADVLRRGAILALQGLGGFQLLVDARRDDAVRELRRRKHREAKPFAVMVGSLAEARLHAELSATEEALLDSPEAPIVLVRKRRQPLSAEALAESVAPGNACLGLLLPTTALHHLLLDEFGFPVVATSGNLSEEPLCTDPLEAQQRLGGVADAFLVHDRPIARPVDDSVARVIAGRPMLLRRARGYAPFPVGGVRSHRALLAVGAHLKNAVAFACEGRVLLSPHIGDLENAETHAVFETTIRTLGRLYQHQPQVVACDEHPDYLSTQWAWGSGARVIPVQHHFAHVLAGMLDNALEPPALGIAWDGSGYGSDGSLWGGEALRVTPFGFDRVAWLKPFPLPGGEAAVREPRRSALGALYAIHGDRLFEDPQAPTLRMFQPAQLPRLRAMLARGINCPITSSAGRLFDAAAALLGLCVRARHEAEAAMALESALDGEPGDDRYAFEVMPEAAGFVLDWAPMLLGLAGDARRGIAAACVSRRFHNTLVEMIVAAAERAGEPRVVLTGGCFQNRYLSERAIARLRQTGFEPFWHRDIPPNDGGIAAGQLLAAAWSLEG